MDVYYAFNYLSAGWMMLEALPLLTAPTLIVAILSPEVREPSQLEVYLSRTLGITLVAFSILNLLLTGSVPLVSTFAETVTAKAASTETSDPTAPYAVPSLVTTLTYHVLVAFHCHLQRPMAYTFAMAAHAGFAAIGVWVLLFATSRGHITRKTGAEHPAGFPFKNEKAGKKV